MDNDDFEAKWSQCVALLKKSHVSCPSPPTQNLRSDIGRALSTFHTPISHEIEQNTFFFKYVIMGTKNAEFYTDSQTN